MWGRLLFLVLAFAAAALLIGCIGAGSTLPPNPVPANPAPSLSSLSSSSVTAGNPGFSLTVNGSNFISASTVQWNGSNRATTFASGSQLTAQILASDIAAAGVAQVTVVNAGPGGGTSSALAFTINNPPPGVTSLSPSSTTAGSGSIALTLNGSNFVSGSTARWSGANRQTTFVSSTQLIAMLLATDIAVPGMAQVTVVNPAPGGGASNAVTFTANAANNAVPSASFLAPANARAGSGAFGLSVFGSGFVPNSTIQWNGNERATILVSPTQVAAMISATDIAAQGTAQLTVVNPAPGGGSSGALTFAIGPPGNPVPTISWLRPSSLPAGSTGGVTVIGANFASGAEVQWNGSNRLTFPGEAGELTAPLTAADLASPGTAQVTVVNPPPGGGTSNALTFTISAGINPVPTLTALSPSSATVGGGDFQLAVSGTNFLVSSRVRTNGFERPTKIINSTKLIASIRGPEIATAGTWPVTVVTPGPGGGTSNALTFTISSIGNPVPTIRSLTPDNVTFGGSPFTLAVEGTGFLPSSAVQWNGSNRPTAFLDTQHISAQIPASDVAAVGAPSVTVFNPAPGGGISNAPTFNVTIPQADGGPSGFPAITPDGRFVAFWSGAKNLIPDTPHFPADVYLRDTCFGGLAGCTPFTMRVSLANDGSLGNDDSFAPGVSADGRFVSFLSWATNLEPNDTNNAVDAFVRDTCLGALACAPSTTRASVAIDGSEANTGTTGYSLSGNGRFVAFSTKAANLVPPTDTNGAFNLFARDTCLGAPPGCTPTTIRVSMPSDGTQAVDSSEQPSISANGSYVAFRSAAFNLLPGAPNGAPFVYLRDTCFGQTSACTPSTIRASLDKDDTFFLFGSHEPAISADGRFVAFQLDSGSAAYFVRDTCLGAPSDCIPTTITASLAFDGNPDNGAGNRLAAYALSASGRFMAFPSVANNLAPDDIYVVGSQAQIFLRDTCFGVAGPCTPTTIKASVNSDGFPNYSASTAPAVSCDGRFVAFVSAGRSLVAGGSNGLPQVYVRDTCFGAPTGCTPTTFIVTVPNAGP